ncbi:unnamed protein product [Pylaiella littoralis]
MVSQPRSQVTPMVFLAALLSTYDTCLWCCPYCNVACCAVSCCDVSTDNPVCLSSVSLFPPKICLSLCARSHAHIECQSSFCAFLRTVSVTRGTESERRSTPLCICRP